MAMPTPSRSSVIPPMSMAPTPAPGHVGIRIANGSATALTPMVVMPTVTPGTAQPPKWAILPLSMAGIATANRFPKCAMSMGVTDHVPTAIYHRLPAL